MSLAERIDQLNELADVLDIKPDKLDEDEQVDLYKLVKVYQFDAPFRHLTRAVMLLFTNAMLLSREMKSNIPVIMLGEGLREVGDQLRRIRDEQKV